MITPPATDSPQPAIQPTSVYRYYDEVGMLIYVGITRQGMGRNLQHNGNAEWWQYVTRQEVEHFADRPTAAAREKALIRQFRPPFNKQHNPDFAGLREAYHAFAASSPQAVTPVALYRRLNKLIPLEVHRQEPGKVVFRTRTEHAPLAELLRPNTQAAALIVERSLGRVTNVEPGKLFSFITCRTRPAMPESIISAAAELKWLSHPKPGQALIRQIRVTCPPVELAA